MSEKAKTIMTAEEAARAVKLGAGRVIAPEDLQDERPRDISEWEKMMKELKEKEKSEKKG